MLGIHFVRQQTESNATPNPMWQYGYGRFDESTGRVVGFERFGHWTGVSWQSGPRLPDPRTNYLSLGPIGGHTGDDAGHAAIRRWRAPHAAVISIEANLEHLSAMVMASVARIVASRAGELGSWIATHAKRPTPVAQYEVAAGETIDFVVDCRGDSRFDTFIWSPVIREVSPTPSEWKAAAGFQGPPRTGTFALGRVYARSYVIE